MALEIGTRLGFYEIVAAIGAGGMGEVYRAHDTTLDRDVALKILPDAFAADPERIARFQREAKTLAALNHPNIAAIYGVEHADGVHALVMELVEGEDLSQRVARGPIPFDEVVPIAKQIAEALEAAHEQGIIHRDLKPANIKLKIRGTRPSRADGGSRDRAPSAADTADCMVKVLDFGLAKALEPTIASGVTVTASPTITTPAMTQVGMILGTAAYMAPEQAKGRAADKRCDIWAFGCVLYEMLSGRRAFEGEDISDTFASILKSEPDWTRLPADIPPAIRTLVQRCLAKDRRQRIADISVAQFLLAESSNLATSSAPTTTAVLAASSPQRSARALPVAAAVLLTATLAGTAAWLLRPSAPPPTVARFAFALSEGQQFLNSSRAVLAISPDGTQVVYGANARLYLRHISELEARAIPGTEEQTVYNPVFSPDGRSIAFFSLADGTLRRVSVSGGGTVTICPASLPSGISWGEDGIVFGQLGGGVLRVSPNGGRPERIVSVSAEEQAQSPQLLPGGQAVLFTLADTGGADRWDKARIVVQSLASGERKTLIDGGSDARYLPTGHLLYALGGTMFAVSFDPKRQEVTSGPVPVVEGVRRPVGAATGAAHLGVSDTGSLVYVPGPAGIGSNALRSIVRADRRGVREPFKLPPAAYVNVRASRDSAHIAVGSDDGKEAIVWIYELAGTSAIRRLTLQGRNRFPIWSADGQRVAFQSDREGDLAIFSQRVDGTGAVERLTKPEQGESHVPESWSPDGKHLLFSVLKGQAFSLWAISVEDKKASAFGSVQSNEPISSVFSPDGRWIAYTSSPVTGGASSPDRGVFIQPFPATGARFQVPKDRLDFHPVWAPDGTELFYVASAASGRFVSVTVKTQPSVTFGSPAPLPAPFPMDATSGQTRTYDILPDGRFIGVVAGSESDASRSAAAPEIRVVLNWFEELKRLVPTR